MALDYLAYVFANRRMRDQFKMGEPHRQVARRAPRHVPSRRDMLADIVNQVANRLEPGPATAAAPR
jgi:hypothetical protein